MPDDEPKQTPNPPGGGTEDEPPQEAEPAGDAAEPEEADRFRPEAIAARVERFGEETDLDRIARQEEQKLQERRKGRGKRALDSAASKRLARIGEGKVKRPSAASDAYIPEADPLIARVQHARRWIEKHRGLFGALVAVAAVALAGGLGWAYWQGKHEAAASAMLAQAIADEHGHISDKDDEDEDESRGKQLLYPTFKSVADRRAAALAKFKDVQAKYAGTGAATLARLGEAGLLLDQGDAPGAKSEYEGVKGSPLAQADPEVRGRALEGIGFAYERLAQKDPANKDKHLDDALAAFRALGQIDTKGLKELGDYHQARVLQAKGDKAKAIELLKDVYKKVTEPGDARIFPYLQFAVEDRLRDLDPSALPPKPKPGAGLGGPGGKPDLSNPQVQELIRQLQEQQQSKERGGPPPAPPPAGTAP